jgi:hypothetical protein
MKKRALKTSASCFSNSVFSLIAGFGVSAALLVAAPSFAAGGSGGSSSQLSYDIGLVSGRVGNQNYTEAHFGLNYWLMDWLNWRNSVFGRFANETAFGLDTTARYQQNIPLTSATSLTMFAGGGYRFVSAGRSAPLIEAGIMANLGAVSIGVTARSILNSVSNSGSTNDTQYMLVLSGGGTL